MMQPLSLYLWPGQTHVGFGAASVVGAEAKALGATHVFLLADPGVVAAGLTQPIEQSIVQAGLTYTRYEKVEPNPSVASVDDAAAAYRACAANIIVAVGGGSGIDTAKGVRMLVGSDPSVSVAQFSFRLGENTLPVPQVNAMPAMIAIPTTAGTGAEVTPWAVITNVTKDHQFGHHKFGIGGPSAIPTVAIVDPELTMTLPPTLTAATGMDALTHLIEAYVSTNHNPILDPMILYGIELLGRSLPLAVAQGSKRTAREEVMLGSLMGGIAISSKWLGACHALAHPLSALANVPHGVANAIMLPHQMEYSLPGALERYARIAYALDPSIKSGMSNRHLATLAIESVRHLLVDCNLPARLRDVGVSDDLLTALGVAAIQDSNWQTNPRRIDQKGLEMLYRAAY